MASSINFQYGPLQEGEIRLIRVSIRDGQIHCELKHVQLGADYDALSYCWGTGDRRVYINGQTTVVRNTLAQFFRRLAGSERWFWADALCINQVDISERSHQVGSMNKIFSQARRVIAWLGLHHHDSRLAVEAMVQPEINWNLDVLYATAHLCHRPYWSRLWVFQELALARDLVLLCDTKRLNLMSMEKLMQSAKAQAWLTGEYDYERLLDSPAFALLSTLTARARLLWDLIMQTKKLKCDIVHDKVYGLLAVSEDVIEADHTKPIHEVLNEVLRQHHVECPPTDMNQVGQNVEHLVAAVLGPHHLRASDIIQEGVMQTPLTRALAPADDDGALKLWWVLQYGGRVVRDLYFAEQQNESGTARRMQSVHAFTEDQAFLNLVVPALEHMPCEWIWDLIISEGAVNKESVWVLDHVDGSTSRAFMSFFDFLMRHPHKTTARMLIEPLLQSSRFGRTPRRVLYWLEILLESRILQESSTAVCILTNWAPALSATFRNKWLFAQKDELLSVLQLAVQGGEIKTLDHLLLKVDVNARNNLGRTALHVALEDTLMPTPRIVERLLRAGADVSTDPSVLCCVVETGARYAQIMPNSLGSAIKDIVEMLLKIPSIDVEARRHGETAYEHAVRTEQFEIAYMIKAARRT